MAITAAEGGISLAEHYAMLTLAGCTAFQSLVGAADATAARERIYFDWPPVPENNADAHSKAELESRRPYAVVWTPDRNRGYMLERIAAEAWDDSGVVLIDIEKDIAEADEADPSEAFRLFKNTLGTILRNTPPSVGLCDLAHQDGYLAINKIEVYGPFRASEEEAAAQGDFLKAQFVLHWGVR